jgi:hypothetical protein
MYAYGMPCYSGVVSLGTGLVLAAVPVTLPRCQPHDLHLLRILLHSRCRISDNFLHRVIV